MNVIVTKSAYWAPRILGSLFAAFLAVFAVDVLGEGHDLLATVSALLIHLVPALIVVVVLAVAWRWDAVGALLFVGLGIAYVVQTGGRFPFTTYLLISGVPVCVGLLFFANWLVRNRES